MAFRCGFAANRSLQAKRGGCDLRGTRRSSCGGFVQDGPPVGRARLRARRRTGGQDLVLGAQVGAGLDRPVGAELRSQGGRDDVLGGRG